MLYSEETAPLWDAFFADRSTENQWKLVIAYLGMAKYQTGKVCKTAPEGADFEAMYSAAVEGLFDAVGHFDPEKGYKFSTYAPARIRGAILDYLRHIDFLPRLARGQHSELVRRRDAASADADHRLNDAEMADELGMSEEEYARLCNQCREVATFSGDNYTQQRWTGFDVIREGTGDDRPGCIFDAVGVKMDPSQKMDTGAFWAEAVKGLSQRERLLMLMYYRLEMSMKDVAKHLGVTESRVSQMHRTLINRLRNREPIYA